MLQGENIWKEWMSIIHANITLFFCITFKFQPPYNGKIIQGLAKQEQNLKHFLNEVNSI